MLVFGLAWVLAAAAQGTNAATAALSTSDTTLTVEAGILAPRLAVLGQRTGWLLKNLSAASLPDHVEVGGAVQPLKWRLDPAASHSDPKEIALTYVSEAPALSLVWRWRARAAFGPIEHSIEIHNLGNATLWCATELTTREQIEQAATVLAQAPAAAAAR